MEPFRKLTSIPIPLLRDNIDTDIIMPARYLKAVTRKGLGKGAFENWRLKPDGAPDPALERIAAEGEAGRPVTVDLEAQKVALADGTVFAFTLDPFRRRCLLEGLDEIGLTLQDHAEAIRAFEARQREEAPWLWATPTTDIGTGGV